MQSRARKILIGGLIAFAAVVTFAIALIVGLGIWIVRPVELLDPARLLGNDTTGYAELTLGLDDAGTEAFLELLAETLNDTRPEMDPSVPPFVRIWFNNANRASLEGMLPMVLAWTLTPGVDGGDLHLGSASIARFGRRLGLADWIAGYVIGQAEAVDVHIHRGERIYEFGIDDGEPDAAAFVRAGTIFVASDVERARQAVELLWDEDAVGREATPLDRLFARTDETDQLRAAITNGNGELRRLWETLKDTPVEDPGPWELLDGAYLSGGLRPDGAFEAEIQLDVPGTAWDQATIDALAEGTLEQLEPGPLDFEIEGTAVEGGVRLDVRVPDLVASLAKLMREAPGRNPRGGVDIRMR